MTIPFEILFRKLQISNTTKIFTRNRSFLQQPRLRFPWWFLRRFEHKHEDHLTPENRQFIDEVKHDKFGKPTIVRGVPTYENASPLSSVEHVQPVEWTPFSRRTGVIARKIGDYPLFSKNGDRILTTLLQVIDNHVVKYIPPEKHTDLHRIKPEPKHKCGCLLVGADCADPTQITAEYAGLFKDSGVVPKKILARFLITPNAILPPGTPLFASHYRVGDRIDIRGKTISHGFQGVIKRWGFKGMPATHGTTKTHRRPGNIGGGGEKARVWPGTKLPGHMGNRWRTLRGAEILRINTKYNVIWVRGVCVPGKTNSYCYLYDSRYYPISGKPPVPLPTYFPTENDEEDVFHESVHDFRTPSITFAE